MLGDGASSSTIRPEPAIVLLQAFVACAGPASQRARGRDLDAEQAGSLALDPQVVAVAQAHHEPLAHDGRVGDAFDGDRDRMSPDEAES
jgi:hypothetical protein